MGRGARGEGVRVKLCRPVREDGEIRWSVRTGRYESRNNPLLTGFRRDEGTRWSGAGSEPGPKDFLGTPAVEAGNINRTPADHLYA